jgi:AAA domain/Bifunctional DNA primase/polymerase, N-terminal
MDLSIFPDKSNYLDSNEYHLALALWYGERGFFVFPCHGKIACVRWSAQSASDAREIERLWRRHIDGVPAIDMARSNAFALDCDRSGEGHDLNDGLAWAIARSPTELGSVPGSITPRTGRHLVWRNCAPPLGCSRGTLPPKSVCNIDPKGSGGYIIAPGSDTSAWGGGYYRPVGDLTALPELPEWVRGYVPVRGAINPPPKPQNAPVGSTEEIKAETQGEIQGEGVEVEPLVIDSYLERALNADSGTDDDGILVLVKRAVRGLNLNNTINAQSHKLGVHVAAGRLSMGQAYVLISQACEQAHQLPADDKAYGADGTIMRGLRAGVASRAAERIQREQEADESNVFPIRLHRGGGGGGGASPEPKSDYFDFGPKPGPEPGFEPRPYEWTEPHLLPPRSWLYGRLLLRRNGTMTIAPGGVGKSSLTIVEALAQVSGRALLHVEAKKILRVWIWNLEDDYDELRRRIQAAAIHHKIAREEIAGRLFVNSSEEDLVVAVHDRNGVKIVRPVIERLIAKIIQHQIDILVVDPFVSCHEAPENDNNMQNKIAKEWIAVARRANCAVHLVHHTRKSGGVNLEVVADSARGASAITNAFRIVRVINRMTDDQALATGVKKSRLHFRTYIDKGNLAPPAENSDWFELHGVNLGNGNIDDEEDHVGVVGLWQYPDLLKGLTGTDFEKLRVVMRRGKWRSQPTANAWVGYAVAEALGKDPKQPRELATIKKYLKDCYAQGALVKIDEWDEAARKTFEFVVLKEDAEAAREAAAVKEFAAEAEDDSVDGDE